MAGRLRQHCDPVITIHSGGGARSSNADINLSFSEPSRMRIQNPGLCSSRLNGILETESDPRLPSRMGHR